jgi:hypothetical protein
MDIESQTFFHYAIWYKSLCVCTIGQLMELLLYVYVRNATPAVIDGNLTFVTPVFSIPKKLDLPIKVVFLTRKNDYDVVEAISVKSLVLSSDTQ